MREIVRENAKDNRYINKTFRVYTGAKDDFGNIKFSTDLTDSAVSATEAFVPILDEIAARFNIPRLRGFKTINSSAGANMGDGVMGINPHTFNFYTQGLVDNGLSSSEIESKLKEAQDALNKLAEERTKVRERLEALYDEHRSITNMRDNFPDAYSELNTLTSRMDDIHNKRREHLKTKDRLNPRVMKASSWKIGDDLKDRPVGTEQYFDNGLDRLHSLLLHEMAHHVHQMFAQKPTTATDIASLRLAAMNRPVEKWLKSNVGTVKNKKFVWADPAIPDRQAGKYGLTNELEWFAENFSVYYMDRKDLVDPLFIELIESMLKGTFNNDQSV